MLPAVFLFFCPSLLLNHLTKSDFVWLITSTVISILIIINAQCYSSEQNSCSFLLFLLASSKFFLLFLKSSSFKHTFNALLMSLHLPRNLLTGCSSWHRWSCSIIFKHSLWRWGAKEGCIARQKNLKSTKFWFCFRRLAKII